MSHDCFASAVLKEDVVPGTLTFIILWIKFNATVTKGYVG